MTFVCFWWDTPSHLILPDYGTSVIYLSNQCGDAYDNPENDVPVRNSEDWEFSLQKKLTLGTSCPRSGNLVPFGHQESIAPSQR